MATIVTMRQLLEAGVHFGHQTKRGDPRMKKYIFTARNDIHVIDLQKTIRLINEAYHFVHSVVSAGGRILFIGTKKQAQEAIKEEALRCKMFYINQRWLGGTLTNFKTIRKSIQRLKHIYRMKEENLFQKLPAKEQSSLNRELKRLEYYLGGISEMNDLPKAVFIIDTHKEAIAVSEAKKLNIPIVGVIDTNGNPKGIKYPIPANDDAIRAIKLLSSVIANAVVEGSKNISSEASASEDADIEHTYSVPDNIEDNVELEAFDIKKISQNMEIEKDFEEEITPEEKGKKRLESINKL